jgi:beta-lactamase regulating signal transducer with metallopeptidase domain
MGLIILIIINLLLLLIKYACHFSEKKVWIITNITILFIFIALIVPACIDINKQSFCTIENVTSIDTDITANKSSKYILIETGNGETYELYDYLIDTQSIQDAAFPGTVIYAKHSKLMLEYLPQSTE